MPSTQINAAGTSPPSTNADISSFVGLDFNDKSDLRALTCVVNGVCMALILSFVSLRFYSRLHILNKLEVDDGREDPVTKFYSAH